MTLRGPQPDLPIPLFTHARRWANAVDISPGIAVLPDVTRADAEPGAGSLVSIYVATGVGAKFAYLPPYQQTQPAADPSDCYAYVIAVQRATAL